MNKEQRRVVAKTLRIYLWWFMRLVFVGFVGAMIGSLGYAMAGWSSLIVTLPLNLIVGYSSFYLLCLDFPDARQP